MSLRRMLYLNSSTSPQFISHNYYGYVTGFSIEKLNEKLQRGENYDNILLCNFCKKRPQMTVNSRNNRVGYSEYPIARK